jgi:hypothetical protein
MASTFKIMLSDKKLKEWYNWGKEGYRSSVNIMRRNINHPDYNTEEKREKNLDEYGDSYVLSDEKTKRLKANFYYSDEDIAKAHESFKAGFNASRKWYQKADKKYQSIIDKWMPLIEQAEEYAKHIDVSDIKDGFPCGNAHLYVQDCGEMDEIRKAIGHFNQDSTLEAYKYRLPISLPSYGQCISFDERICKEVADFLRNKGLFVNTYSWID